MAKFNLILLVSGYLLANCFDGGAALGVSLNKDKGPTTRVKRSGSAVPGEFPFMLRVAMAEAAGCGAVLISPTCALTAAHCVRNHFYHTVIAGDLDADQWEETEQVTEDARVTHHPGYNPATLENDIAFIRTLEPFKTVNNTFVRPIELPAQGSMPSTSFNATVMGWGGPAPAGGRQGDKVLKKAVVSTWIDQDCREVYGNDRIKDSMLCAGSEEDDVEIFAEDAGGPLNMSLDAESSILIGLVSWSTRKPTDPGVYTEIAYFMPWIQDLLNQNVSKCSRY